MQNATRNPSNATLLSIAHVKKLNSKPPSMPGAFFPKGWPVVGIYGIDNLN
jgi:hypothetical protein